jgi:hypothetical protein
MHVDGADYTRTWMRTVALFLAVIFVAIASIDPLCCADGCTRAGFAVTHHTQSGGDCPICQPGAVAAAPHHLAAGTLVVSLVFSPEDGVIDSFSPTIEHPPRRPA